MESSARPAAATFVPQACLAARAVLHDRAGHAVVAHYGSVASEIAVCMTSVGLAHHSDYGVLELRGDRDVLDRALIARFGEPALAIGSGRRRRDVWHLRTDARHALLVGPHAALAAAPAAGPGRELRDLVLRDIGASLAIVGIVGPRAVRLLACAGLPDGLLVGAVDAGGGDAGVIALLRESQRRYLALVGAGVAEAFWARLLAAGKPLGAAFVGYDALALLDASSR